MRCYFSLLVCLSLASWVAAEEVRTWTDSQGRKMQAQFVREVDGDVTFLKDGKLITLALEKLSEEDQKFIRDAEANKKVEEIAPPAGAPRQIDTSPLPLDSGSASETKSSLTKSKVVAEERTWRDLRGKPQVGKFVRMHQGFVVISSGPRAIRMPFYNLSRPDREYVRELLAARGETAQLPPDTAGSSGSAGIEQPTGEAGPPAEPVSAPVAAAPPPSDPPPMPRGGQGAGRSAGAPSGNDRLAQMQEESRKRLADMQERNRQMVQQNQERARQSLERLKPNLAPQQAESPQDLVGSCSNCKKSITREQSGGMKCPHCGVIWEYEIDEFGRKKEIPGAKEAIAATGGWAAGWKWEDRHYVKLFTRIIIPIILLLFGGAGAALRGRR